MSEKKLTTSEIIDSMMTPEPATGIPDAPVPVSATAAPTGDAAEKKAESDGPRIYKTYELTIGDACEKRRAFGGIFKDKESDRYKEAVVLQTALKDCLNGDLDLEDLPERLEAGYYGDGADDPGLPFRNEQQKRIRVSDGIRQIGRYVKSEKRRPIYFGGRQVEMTEGLPVHVAPTFCFINDDGTFEAVKVKNSKPFITEKGAYESLEMYALMLWAREIAKGIPAKITKLKASVYYLRRKDDSDSVDKPNFEADFFKETGGGNVVSIVESFHKRSFFTPVPFAAPKKEDEEVDEKLKPKAKKATAFKGTLINTPELTDKAFAPAVKKFVEGVPETECTDDDCERCAIRDECKFTLPPKAIVKVPVVRSLRDLQLTDAQSEAVEYDSGVCRINAGAGSGKTTVVAVRVVTLLEKDVDPKSILLITFTNAGAKEMRERINMYCEDFGLETNADDMTICTFNSFGDEIIKNEYAKLGFSQAPRVIDDVERSRIIADILEGTAIKGLNYRNFNSRTKNCKGALTIACKVFQIMKANRLGKADVSEIVAAMGMDIRFCGRSAVEELTELYDQYDEKLRSRDLIEFSDQEGLVFEILLEDPFYLERFGFKHVIVDEFQDSNEGQIKLIKLLRECPGFESLMVVGDDSQAIFGFRDTTPEYIVNFPKYVGEEVDDIFLLENHRSTPEIIEFANKINALNVRRVAKDLVATRAHGKPVVVKGFLEKAEERDWVVDNVKAKIDDGHKPEDIAVICSTKTELLEMADALQKKDIPTVLLNPEPLMDNSRVKAAISMVYAIEEPDDEKDLLAYANALMGGGVLEASKEDAKEAIEKAKAKIDALNAMVSDGDKKTAIMEMFKELDADDEVYESFVDSMGFKPYAKILEWCNDFYEYGSGAAVRRVSDYPGVALTTAHSSKGLEWPIVFDMISKYDSELMHKGRRSIDDVEEKRRLLFVSATRARDELYVTAQYVAYGKRGAYVYNQFLKDSMEAVGNEFSITSIEVEREARAALKKALKAEEKAGKAKESLDKAKETA